MCYKPWNAHLLCIFCQRLSFRLTLNAAQCCRCCIYCLSPTSRSQGPCRLFPHRTPGSGWRKPAHRKKAWNTERCKCRELHSHTVIETKRHTHALIDLVLQVSRLRHTNTITLYTIYAAATHAHRALHTLTYIYRNGWPLILIMGEACNSTSHYKD